MKGNKIGMNLVNEVKMKDPGIYQERPCQKAVSESENHRRECCQSNGMVYVTVAKKLGFKKIKSHPKIRMAF
jgi:hypothetical protein